MNGQTGKLVGDLPIDWKKTMGIGGSIFAIAAAILSAIGLMLMPEDQVLNIIKMISGLGILISGIVLLVLKHSKSKAKKGGGGSF